MPSNDWTRETETRCSVGLARGAHVRKWTVIRADSVANGEWCSPPCDSEKNKKHKKNTVRTMVSSVQEDHEQHSGQLDS